MTLTVGSLLSALLWSAVAGLVVWLLLWPVRRRSLTGLFAAVVLTSTAASLGAVVGGIHAMLLPMADLWTVVVLGVAAGVVTALAGAAAARRLVAENRLLLREIEALGAGASPPVTDRPLTAELDDLRAQLHRTAETLATARSRERALESARRDLVSWVSHDLRTPLAGLRAIAEALEDGVVADPSVYYKQIAASVDRLSEMVDDLFDLSRIQAGSVSPDLEAVSLDDLVSDCIAALTPLATASGVALHGVPSGSATVLGNGPQLDRALTNVIVNAIRHTRDGGAVDVRLDVADEAAVTVCDECGGIPTADLPRVFEAGFRGEAARTPHAGGGMGLAIAKGIVEAHDGTVDVTNGGPGCCFRVRLPLAR